MADVIRWHEPIWDNGKRGKNAKPKKIGEPVNRQARNSDVIDKIKTEAQKLRDIVPEMFRKNGYEADAEKTSLGNEWIAATNKEDAKPMIVSPKSTMASAFNGRAGNDGWQNNVRPAAETEKPDFV